MAISRTIRPTVIASGFVVSVRDRNRSTANGGARYGWDVTLQQESGARLVVQVFEGNEGTQLQAAQMPAMGELWAVLAEVTENAQYGASLVYGGEPYGELDAIFAAGQAQPEPVKG
jgi:hypothetical protein